MAITGNQPRAFGGRLQRETLEYRSQAVRCCEATRDLVKEISQPLEPQRHRKANGPWTGEW